MSLPKADLLLFTDEVDHGNYFDCSLSTVLGWWWGLGLLSLAWLVRSPATTILWMSA
jgi:hypothetical protein